MRLTHSTSLPRLGRTATLLSATVALAACATLSAPQRNQYAQAKEQVQRLESEQLAGQAAGEPLQRARMDLANADEAAQHNNGAALVYWSYLAQREAQSGQAMVDELQAQNEIASASAQRARLLMDYQRRRAEMAQAHAAASDQRAQQAEAQLQQVQQQQAQQQTDAQIAQARDQAQQQVQAAQQQTEEAKRQEDMARQELENMQARQTSQGMLLTLSNSLLFATGRDVIEPGALPALNSVAAFLQQHGMVKIRVEGFTDSRGADAYNDALSQRRAQAVGNALQADGVDPSRLVVLGRGASLPIASNDTSAGRQQNRRVELLFSDTEGRFASNESGQALR